MPDTGLPNAEVIGIPLRGSIIGLDRPRLRLQARQFFGLHPNALRVAFGLLTLLGGTGLIVYGFLWATVPEETTTVPETTLPGGGTRPMMPSAPTLFPEPDSPTIARVSPGFTE